jgi:hypothetical protein
MRYLDQIFTDAGLIGLLAIPTMTQVRIAEAGFQSNVIAFELGHYPTALYQQPSLVQPPAIADLGNTPHVSRYTNEGMH